MLQEALRHGIIELVLRSVMYLIRYFQGVWYVDCQINPRLTRDYLLIPENNTDFNSMNV